MLTITNGLANKKRMQCELKERENKRVPSFPFTNSHDKAGVLWQPGWHSNSHRDNMIISHIDTLPE